MKHVAQRDEKALAPVCEERFLQHVTQRDVEALAHICEEERYLKHVTQVAHVSLELLQIGVLIARLPQFRLQHADAVHAAPQIIADFRQLLLCVRVRCLPRAPRH